MRGEQLKGAFSNAQDLNVLQTLRYSNYFNDTGYKIDVQNAKIIITVLYLQLPSGTASNTFHFSFIFLHSVSVLALLIIYYKLKGQPGE